MDAPAYDVPLPSPLPYVGFIFGPLLVGACLNSLFYGVLALQVLIYFMYYKQDRKWIKCYVLYLFFVETVNLGCNIAIVYDPLVTHYGSVRALTSYPILAASTSIMTAAVSAPVQVFTAWRIVVLTGRKWVGAIIVVLSLLSLGGGVWLAVMVAIVQGYYAEKNLFVTPSIFWLSTLLIVDIAVTTALYFSLSTRKTGFKSTDVMINKIIKLTLQTGMLTLVMAAANLFLFLVFAHNTSNFAVLYPLSKLYSNALLSTLNSRLSWRTLGDVEIKAEDDNLLFGSREQTNMPHPNLSRRPPRNLDYSHGTGRYQPCMNCGKIPNQLDTSLYGIPARDFAQEEDAISISQPKNVAADSVGDLSSNFKVQ